jgi:hypothetical protein
MINHRSAAYALMRATFGIVLINFCLLYLADYNLYSIDRFRGGRLAPSR